MNKRRAICILTVFAAACGAPSGQPFGNADSATKDSVQQDTVKDTYDPAAAPATNGQF